MYVEVMFELLSHYDSRNNIDIQNNNYHSKKILYHKALI